MGRFVFRPIRDAVIIRADMTKQTVPAALAPGAGQR